jgi:hypothetical protein
VKIAMSLKPLRVMPSAYTPLEKHNGKIAMSLKPLRVMPLGLHSIREAHCEDSYEPEAAQSDAPRAMSLKPLRVMPSAYTPLEKHTGKIAMSLKPLRVMPSTSTTAGG